MRFSYFSFLIGFVLTLCLIGGRAGAETKTQNFRAQSPTMQTNTGSNPGKTWLYYYEDQGSVDFARLSSFITQNPHFPAMGKLTLMAERAMPADLPPQRVMQWFAQYPPRSLIGMILYARALEQEGQGSAIKKAVQDWWPSASLSREEQRDGYARFQSHLDAKSHAARMRVLIYEGAYTNARAIAAALGAGYQALAEARIALRTGKGNPDALIQKIPSSLLKDEGLLFDRLQLRRKNKNNAGAIEILKMMPVESALHDPEDWAKERGIIVRRLFEQNQYKQAYTLAASHGLSSGSGLAQNEWMAGWLAYAYLKQPWQAFEHFERLYHKTETPLSKSRGAYWAGLASIKLGHPEIARKWFDVASRYKTTFYGQLAAQQTGQKPSYQLSDIQPAVAFHDLPAAQAARWLAKNGYEGEAGMFINALIDEAVKPEEFAAIASLAKSLSLSRLSIAAAQESEKKTGVVLSRYAFPMIDRYLSGNDLVEWALVHALIRQESRYDTGAISKAGARGLMQLMPATAKEVARKAGIGHSKDWLISKPSHNVALGTRYLQQMIARYDGSYVLALAAYNAGPGRVDRWIDELGDPRKPGTDIVQWIETIPIYETRNYVQRVLESTYVYRHILPRNGGREKGRIHIASK